MGRIGTSVTIDRVLVEPTAHGLKIGGGDNAVGVEKDQITAFGPLHAIVAGEAAPRIFLVEIADDHAVGILARHLVATARGAIFDEEELKILAGLHIETFEQFPHLVGAVVDGNDNRKKRFGCSHNV